MRRSLWVKIGCVLSLLGILVAGYILYQQAFAPAHWCVIGQKFNCSLVSQSQFGWMDGVFGLIGVPFPHIANALAVIPVFVLLGVGCWWLGRGGVKVRMMLRVLSVLAMGYALILLGIAMFILGAFCIFCLMLDAILLGLLLVIWHL